MFYCLGEIMYEPVTEFGKTIADMLKWDDQVRLDIHEYLEKIEPELQEALEKAEAYDLIHMTVKEYKKMSLEKKIEYLERILKAIIDEEK